MFARIVGCISVALAVSGGSSARAELLYGGGTETGSRYNPGSGEVITFMNCFVDAGGASQLALDAVEVGIRRIFGGGSLTAVGIEVFVAEMTFDGRSFGAGEFISLGQHDLLGGGTGSLTELVSSGASGLLIDLETQSTPGLGGLWVGVRFFGPNAANNANGWRVVNAPSVGSSINGFGLFNAQGSGAFEAFYGFGNPPGASPSRFLANVYGALVPAPGALGLLAVAGLALSRRRRA